MKPRGVAFKLTLATLAGTTGVLAMIVGYNYVAARRTIIKDVENNARTLAAATVNRVETVLHATERVPAGVAAALEIAGLSSPEMLALLRRVVGDNEGIYGAAIAFEPYAFDPQSEYFAPYVFKSGGRIQTTALGNASYRYSHMDWYQIPRETDRPNWTEPYFDEGGGNAVMSTYSVPFYSQVNGEKRFMGVVTADVSLDWLTSIVSAIRILNTGYAFVISHNGMFVTHPMRDLVMNETIFSVAETRNDARLRSIGRSMIAGRSDFVETDCFGIGRSCWLVYAPITANGWALGAVFPTDELFADVGHLSRTMLGLGAVGSLLLLAIVVTIARSVTRPLTALAAASEQIARGTLDSPLPQVTARDEVGQLTRAFARMQRDVRRYVEDLQRTTAEKERAAEQLAEYSRTLEQRVDERTRELRDKNSELQSTLTRLEQTQAQLLVQEKLASLGQLTAGIAHEIKNPLNFVTNFAQLSTELVQDLRAEISAHGDGFDDDSRGTVEDLLTDLETNVAKINEHGKRADGIVRGMLQHSRSGTGQWEPTALNSLLGEYTTLAYRGLCTQDPGFAVAIVNDYDAAVGSITAVPQDLSRALFNIVKNACQAAYDKGQRQAGGRFTPTVSVRTKNLGDRVEVRIRDNGDGIPAAVRGRLFEPFFTTRPTGQGTGLGLSIAHDTIVQQHHGTIEIESEEGRFAEFIITLPRDTSEAADVG